MRENNFVGTAGMRQTVGRLDMTGVS